MSNISVSNPDSFLNINNNAMLKYSAPTNTYTVLEEIKIDAYLSFNTTTSGNWEWASEQDWCSGSGFEKDPYIIKNIQSLKLEIYNSQVVYFKIIDSNLTLPSNFQKNESGVIFNNSTRGVIKNVLLSNISITQCSNLIIENNSFYNYENFVINSEKIYFYENMFKFDNTEETRLKFINSQKCELYNNSISGGKNSTIKFSENSSFNQISNNLIVGNPIWTKSAPNMPFGIINENSDSNFIINNTIMKYKTGLINNNSNSTFISNNFYFQCQDYGILLNNSYVILITSDNQFYDIHITEIYPEIEFDIPNDIIDDSGIDDQNNSDDGSNEDINDDTNDDSNDGGNQDDGTDDTNEYPPYYSDSENNTEPTGIDNDNNEEDDSDNQEDRNPDNDPYPSYFDALNDVFKEIKANNLYMVLVSMSILFVSFVLINGFMKIFDDE